MAIFTFLNNISSYISFACGLIIFISSFYIVLHNRKIPQWILTMSWYVGLSSMFIVFTHLVGWATLDSHPLSYVWLGKFGEALLNMNLAIIAGVVFFQTVKEDMVNCKFRKPYDDSKPRVRVSAKKAASKK